MNKNLIYVIDVLTYFFLTIISTVVGYTNLSFVEQVENEFNVFYVYTFNVAREYISLGIMAVALGFLLYYIYRVNKELIEQSIVKSIFKEILLLITLLILVGFYLIAPFIFMVTLPNQVIPSSELTQIIKYAITFLPFIFYVVMIINTIIKKIKG
jgi:hypothetical protein